MLLAIPVSWSEDWLLYHKVIFDGTNRLIIVNTNEPIISVKQHIYSAWKEWVQLRDNGKFLPALRVTGGDPTGDASATGDVYFTINNWRILVTSTCNINGSIFSDDYPSPFMSPEDTKIVTNAVSSIVQSLGFNGTVNVAVDPTTTPQAIWDYLIQDANTPGSVGERVSKLLTVAKFLGLK